VHPSGAAHRILASVVLSTIAAPIQASYAGEGGIQAAGDHSRAVKDELLSDFQLDREVGSVRGYATVNYGRQDFENNAGTNILGGEADTLSLTLGANHRISENAYWGVGITLGNHDNDIASANLDSRAFIASIGGALRFGGGGYVSGAVSGGSTGVDVTRYIVMGPTVREESGSTNASQFGAELGFGWLFGSADGLQHGPFIGAQWVQQTVDGYAEDSGLATSMNYSEFDRDSLVTSAGYQLMGRFGDSERSVRPFARVAFNEEGEDDQIEVNAGSNSMPGRFTLGGFTPSKDWISADLGVQFMVGESTTAYLSYSGRFSDDLQERNSFGLGLRTTF
jgi:outer membrane lipase/esterase